MRPHWMIDMFTSLEDVTRRVDPWQERVWEEPGDADESRMLVWETLDCSASENAKMQRFPELGNYGLSIS